MDKPIITVITPNYNSINVFKRTFDSVISQTFKDFEWIIIDDCSSDSSFEYIKEVIKDNKNISLYKTDKNGGSAVARNIGLKYAKGRYITFLDSDDTLDPNYLESQYNFIKDNGPIITAGYRRVTENSNSVFMPRKTISYKELLKGNDCSCLTTMYDREVIGDICFHEDLIKSEDFIFWLEILKKGYLVKTNPNVLATYHITKQSKNGTKRKLFKPTYIVYHKVLGFNFFKTTWYMGNYFIYGVKKYRKVK